MGKLHRHYGEFKWGRPSKEEISFIRACLKKGETWTMIGNRINRYSRSVALTIDNHSKRNLGAWSVEENQRLHDAVHAVTNTTEKDLVFQNIPWVKVKELVKTRTSTQCKERWKYIVFHTRCFRLVEEDEISWSHEDDLQLLQFIIKAEVDKLYAVD